MSTRDDIAKVLAFSGSGLKGLMWDLLSDASRAVWRAKADALLASPTLARLLNEARAEGWDQGFGAAADEMHPAGPRAPREPNPYRKDIP